MLHHYFDQFILYLHAHPHMGILFAFVVAFLESLPILGTIIPGAITMTAVGAMIGAGLIPGYITLAIASFGAFLGDIVGFIVGRVFKEQLKNIWPFKQYPKIISVSEAFIKKHGGKSILIGRFVGAVRSAVPMVAGVLHMSWLRFLIAALPTAILWSVLYSMPGMILGAFSMEIPPKLLTEYIGLGILIITFLWLLYWLVQHFFNNIRQFYTKQIDRFWTFLQKHRSSHFIIKWIYNHQKPHSHYQLSRLLLALLCALLFIIMLISVMTHGSLTHINAPAFSFAQSLRIYHLDPFFITLSLCGEPRNMICIALILSAILLYCKQWRASAHLCGATLIAAGIAVIIKYAHLSSRPMGFMIVKDSSSFPSGHTMLSLVVLGLLAFYTARYFRKNRGIIYTITSLFIALIAMSRLYVGAHWLIDVIASALLGLTILLLTLISYQRLPKPTSALNGNRWVWLISLFSVLVIVWSSYIYFEYHHNVYRYTPFHTNMTTTEENWWVNPLSLIPLYRTNRLGHAAEPLNLQWAAANIADVEKILKQNGWFTLSHQHHIENTINRLASTKAQYHLPLFETLYQNNRPILIMYKNIPQESTIYLLRLWDAHLTFTNQQRLWVGVLNKLAAPHHIITLMHRNRMSFAKLDIQMQLQSDPKGFEIKPYDYQIPSDNQSQHVKHYKWDGQIWLIRSSSH